MENKEDLVVGGGWQVGVN